MSRIRSNPFFLNRRSPHYQSSETGETTDPSSQLLSKVLCQPLEISGQATRHPGRDTLLLEPVVVINPYAKQLSSPSRSLRARRDHKKYPMLMKAIAFLHQYQREIKVENRGDQVLRYIDITQDDIRKANALALHVLGHSLDELSAPARNLLQQIHAMVKVVC